MNFSKQNVGFFLCSTSWGGLELNVYKLACWLTARNWNITFYVVENSRIHTELKTWSKNIVVVENHRKYFDISKAYTYSQLLKRDAISTLFVFDNRDIDSIFFAKQFLRNKITVVYQQQMQLGVSKRDLIHTIRFSAIDYWITLLDCMKEQVLTRTRLSANKIHIIPLCVEIEKLTPPKYSKEQARRLLNINQSSKIIGIMGRIDRLKGQLFLIQAIKQLQKQNADLELLIIGEPTLNEDCSMNYFSEIEQFISKNNLQQKIHIRKFTNDVGLFYNSIDIFALASESETFGMVTIEALISGIPVIATNAGGTPEILQNGSLGTLYEYNNLNNFCDNVHTMLTNSNDTALKAKKAQQIAIERYSHHNECEQMERMLTM